MRTFTALVNPLGRGRVWGAVEARLGDALTVEHTASSADTIARATAAAARGEVVLAVGGDGMVRDVADGVVAGGGVMGIVPAGRGNDLAGALGIPDDVDDLIDLLIAGPEQAIDVLDANGRIVPGNVFAGLDSVAGRTANAMRWMPGSVVYTLAALMAVVRWRAPEYTLTIDGVTTKRRLHLCVVANSGQYGNGYRIAPEADLMDGKIDLLTVDSAFWKGRIGSIMKEARTGAHAARPEVESRRCTSVTIDCDRPIPLNSDGDEIDQLPVTVTIRPGALRILAP